MWSPVFALLVLGGCAQIFGIETTSEFTPDARGDAAPMTDAAPLPCAGGDAHTVDQGTGACYMFFTAPMTRDAARSVCMTFGSTVRLASIQSVSESAVVTSLIGTSQAFLGGSDELVEGTFVWDDGTPVQLTNWNTGEPNDAGGLEDCIEIIGSLGGKWNDVPCTGLYPFVCERD